jgi:hypothetical protein
MTNGRSNIELIVDWPSPSPTIKDSSSGVLLSKPDNGDIKLERASRPHQDRHSDSDIKDQQLLDGLVRRPCRRPSAMSSSCSSSRIKHVTFRLRSQVKIIEPKSDDDIKASWLSDEEKHQIQRQFTADIKMLKRIAKLPETAMNDPQIQQVKSSLSIRGLEHFCSKRLHKERLALQQDHIHAVLETQDMQRDMARRSGIAPVPLAIAKISAEHSLQARRRALRQGMEDEAAVSAMY